VSECAEIWELTLGEPYAEGAVGHVVRARLPDGTPAALKIGFPHRESEREPDALERWGGDGAVLLLARDDARGALLLERCEPGTHLSESADALDVLIGLVPRLWTNADGFFPLEEEAAIWADHVEREVADSRLKDVALRYIAELASTQGEQVLVHQDLHGENVLAAEREPWLVIDPKPLAAERELSVASIVRSFELGHGRREVFRRLDRLCSELGLDRERAKGWTMAQTIAWSGGSDYVETHMETVQWLLEES
jgi:streptomycin 6-kinase